MREAKTETQPGDGKRHILITACYILEAERNEFWDAETGRLTESNEAFLKTTAFPPKLEFPGGRTGERYYVKHRIVDYPQVNFLTCPICGRPLTDPAKPNPIYELDNCVKADGVGLCPGCAYQLDCEIKRDGILKVIEKYRREAGEDRESTSG